MRSASCPRREGASCTQAMAACAGLGRTWRTCCSTTLTRAFRCSASREGRASGSKTCFLLRIALHQLEPAKYIKAVVDGVTAAMQRDEPGRVAEAAARLAKLLNADASELLRHATAADAPLGARSRSSPASRESLFTLRGPAELRVTPDDDRCIAAEVTTAGDDGPPRLSVGVYSATCRAGVKRFNTSQGPPLPAPLTLVRDR
jgi:hypothetical protein